MEETGNVDNASELLDQLTVVEGIAEEILSDRQEITDLDRKRNKTREATRALQKTKDNKVWLCAGNTFLKFEKKKAVNMLNKDLNALDDEISRLHSSLKPKVNQLRQLENKDDLKGFNLKALSKDEWSSVSSIL